MASNLQSRIKDYILINRLRPAICCPTKPSLMAALGVGRHPLREAIEMGLTRRVRTRASAGIAAW